MATRSQISAAYRDKGRRGYEASKRSVSDFQGRDKESKKFRGQPTQQTGRSIRRTMESMGNKIGSVFQRAGFRGATPEEVDEYKQLWGVSDADYDRAMSMNDERRRIGMPVFNPVNPKGVGIGFGGLAKALAGRMPGRLNLPRMEERQRRDFMQSEREMNAEQERAQRAAMTEPTAPSAPTAYYGDAGYQPPQAQGFGDPGMWMGGGMQGGGGMPYMPPWMQARMGPQPMSRNQYLAGLVGGMYGGF